MTFGTSLVIHEPEKLLDKIATENCTSKSVIKYTPKIQSEWIFETWVECEGYSYLAWVRSRVQKFPAWPTFYGDRNKTNLLFFNIVSLYFNTLFNWYINLTIDGTIYPSQHFPFGPAFVCQAGNFWTLLRSLTGGYQPSAYWYLLASTKLRGVITSNLAILDIKRIQYILTPCTAHFYYI